MPDLAPDLDGLDRARAAFLDRVGAMTDAQRAFRPAPAAWSPVEIAEHVWRTEAGIVRGLERQAGGDRRDLGPRQPGGLDRLAERMRSGRRLRMPERSAKYVAPQGAGWETVREGWRATAADWRRVAAALPDDMAGVGVIRHPVSGPLTPAESVRFAGLHLEHHGRQLDRTVGADGFPAAPERGGATDRRPSGRP